MRDNGSLRLLIAGLVAVASGAASGVFVTRRLGDVSALQATLGTLIWTATIAGVSGLVVYLLLGCGHGRRG